MIKTRFVLPVLAILAAIVVAGCGESDSAGSDSAPSPAELAQPGSLVYVEGDLRPTGELKANVDSAASTIAGVDNLGDFIVSKLEDSAQGNGKPVDYATEIDPWLGKTAGVAFSHLENDGDLSDPLIAIETTNATAAQGFIDKQADGSAEPSKDGSYEGVDFTLGGSEGNAVGMIDEYLVIADGEKDFKAAVDAADGDSLGGEDRFQTAFAATSNGSLADVYVDVGGVLEQSGDKIDPQAQEVLQGSGVDPSEATAVASVIPGSNEIEVDLSSDLGGEEAPSGDVSELLGSMPAGAAGAFAVSGFSDQLQEAIDNLDEAGIPPDLPPDKLKSTLSQAGIDLDKIAGSLEDAAVFVAGSGENDIGGAMVVTSDGSDEAASAIASLGTLLRGAKVPGVTAISGNAAGFSIRSTELGPKPVVVIARGTRIAIGYGVAETRAGLNAGSGATLSGSADYKAAVSSLGKIPISAFIDGPAALRLAEALVPRDETDFWEATPYLKKIRFLALGAGPGSDPATAKLIAGLQK
jgi:hypothetical protein